MTNSQPIPKQITVTWQICTVLAVLTTHNLNEYIQGSHLFQFCTFWSWVSKALWGHPIEIITREISQPNQHLILKWQNTKCISATSKTENTTGVQLIVYSSLVHSYWCNDFQWLSRTWTVFKDFPGLENETQIPGQLRSCGNPVHPCVKLVNLLLVAVSFITTRLSFLLGAVQLQTPD